MPKKVPVTNPQMAVMPPSSAPSLPYDAMAGLVRMMPRLAARIRSP